MTRFVGTKIKLNFEFCNFILNFIFALEYYFFIALQRYKYFFNLTTFLLKNCYLLTLVLKLH